MEHKQIRQKDLSAYATCVIEAFYAKEYETVPESMDEQIVINGTVSGNKHNGKYSFKESLNRTADDYDCRLSDIVTTQVDLNMTHSETISTFDCQVRDKERSVTTISMIYHVVAINRSVVTMMSGDKLKIPRGKYKEVKQQLCWI